MAIAFESFASTNLDNTATGTLNLPTGTTSGDVLVFVADTDGTNGIAALTGFTNLFGGPVAGSGGTFRGSYQYRVCDGAEPSSYTISMISGSERVACALLRFSGVDNTNPINASGTNSGGSNTSVIFPSGITTSAADCVVVAAISNESGNSGNPIVPSWPADWTERYDNENGPPGNGSASASCAAATFEQSTAGAVTSETVTITGGNSFWISAYIALTPAASNPEAELRSWQQAPLRAAIGMGM